MNSMTGDERGVVPCLRLHERIEIPSTLDTDMNRGNNDDADDDDDDDDLGDC